MDFDAFARKVDRFLYRRSWRQLTADELKMAEDWSLDVIRKNHPQWNDEQVHRYYNSLLKVKSYAVDEFGRRLN